jgi:Peptidyl-prolyl cis-trans isomerase (rotamase) - cyclophilin family
MKSFLISLFLSGLLLAQFTSDDAELVKTAFQKKFDKKIISDYLNSGSVEKINAALLCIAASEDTAFVPEIIKTDFNANGKFITFALGQLGQCSLSEKYLAKKIFNNKILFGKESLTALGKTASLNYLDTLIKNYFANKSNDWSGISSALLNFNLRGVKTPETTRQTFEIFKNEFSAQANSPQRVFDALFVLYRLGGSELCRNDLIKLLNHFDTLEVEVKQYLLACLRRVNYFPDNIGIYEKLVDEKNWLVRCEAAKLLPFFPHKNKTEAELYIKLLTDKNPNVSRQAAISIQSIKITDSLKTEIGDELLDILTKQGLTENSRGELFKSILKLYPHNFEKLYPVYRNIIRSDFVYEIIGSNYKSINNSFDTLSVLYTKENLKNKILIAGILLSMDKETLGKDKFKDIVFNGLSSGEASLVSIFADGIKDTFIVENSTVLKNIITEQINTKQNDAGFYEGTTSLVNLAKKISLKFHQTVLSSLSKSDVYSVKKFVSSIISPKAVIGKDASMFEKIWSKAFIYKSADVLTEKGNIHIEFLPGYAPVSVGSFCSLAENNFFNNNSFHRVVPGFVIQGGDPTETGFGGPGYEIVTEPSPLSFNTGAVGMASAGKDTEGSQWFIMQGDYPHLDGKYSLFAKVSSSIKAVDLTEQSDKIIRIKLNP